MTKEIDKFFEKIKREAGFSGEEKEPEKLPDHIEAFFEEKKQELINNQRHG